VDDLEFRKRVSIDPNDQSAEFIEKTQQSKHNQRFVEQRLTFERLLATTLDVDVPENLHDRIILSQQLSQHKHHNRKIHRNSYWWLSAGLAASLFIALSLSLLLPETMSAKELAQQVATHVHEDTHALDVNMNVPKSNIDTMLASYGGRLNGPIGHVSFLGHCIVGEHTGIHMVLDTKQGLVTVIILPTQSIRQPSFLVDKQFNGLVYPSQKGSIAIVAEHSSRAIEETRQKITQSLNWII
jgi:hypothetical protein